MDPPLGSNFRPYNYLLNHSMATANLSTPLISGTANYNAGDVARAGISGGVDLEAVASLGRGFEVGLGVEALLTADAAFNKFVSAEIAGLATAAASVKAQLRAPIDLFRAAGVVAMLDARAEAAASVQLGLGVSVGDFVELAAGNPAIGATGLKLLRAILSEPQIRGGLYAKAAVSAMAYGGLECTVCLIPQRNRRPGVRVSATAGLGLKAGAGFKGYFEVELTDPRRLVRRIVDIVVDDTLSALAADASPQDRAALNSLQIPAKIALRTCMEVGHEAATQARAGALNCEVLAQRTVQVALEEAQSAYFSEVMAFAGQEWRAAFEALMQTPQTWQNLRAERYALADALDAIDRGDGADLQALWAAFSQASEMLLTALPAGPLRDRLLDAYVALWSARQLLDILLERTSSAQARAELLGKPLAAAAQSFSGPLVVVQPPLLVQRMRVRVGGAGALRREDLLAFVLDAALLEPLLVSMPSLAELASALTGSAAPSGVALREVLSQSNTLRDASGQVRVIDQLFDALSLALSRQLDSAAQRALTQSLSQWPASRQPEARMYLNDVLRPALSITVRQIFGVTRTGVRQGHISGSQITEACSSVLLNILNRALVVSADVLLDLLLRHIAAGLREFGRRVDEPGGVAVVIAKALRSNRRDVARELRWTLDLVGEVFAPLPASQRARIRNAAMACGNMLLAVPEDQIFSALADGGRVADADSAAELIGEIAHTIGARLELAVEIIVREFQQAGLRLLQDRIAASERQIRDWEKALRAEVLALERRIRELAAEILRLAAQAVAAERAARQSLRALGNTLSTRNGRESLQSSLTDLLVRHGVDALSDLPAYDALPVDIRRTVRGVLRHTAATLIEGPPADAVLEVVGGLAGQVVQVQAQLEALAAGAALKASIMDAMLDQFEADVRRAMRPLLAFQMRLEFEFFGPKVIQLGTIRLPLDTAVQALRTAASNLPAFQQEAEAAARTVASWLQAMELERSAKAVHERQRQEHQASQRRIRESRLDAPAIEITAPKHLQSLSGAVRLQARLHNVPSSMLEATGSDPKRLTAWIDDQELAWDTNALRALPGNDMLLDLSVPAGLLAPGGHHFSVWVTDGVGDLRTVASVVAVVAAPRPTRPARAAALSPARQRVGGRASDPLRAPERLDENFDTVMAAIRRQRRAERT